jgi:hypothetical protein
MAFLTSQVNGAAVSWASATSEKISASLISDSAVHSNKPIFPFDKISVFNNIEFIPRILSVSMAFWNEYFFAARKILFSMP